MACDVVIFQLRRKPVLSITGTEMYPGHRRWLSIWLSTKP